MQRTSNISKINAYGIRRINLYKAPVYLDDINIHSKIFEQHLKDLRKMFECLRKANLKIRLNKYQFCEQELKFLGHIVGKDGIKTDEEKIIKVKEFLRLKNKKEI